MMKKESFNLWASACCHVGTDMQAGKRESLAEAIRQSEGRNGDGAPSFDWDIAVHLGDFSGNQSSPDDAEGRELVRQFGALKEHRREDFYCLVGNHDASLPDEPTQWWFKKYVDPTGEHRDDSGVRNERRQYAVEGTWERYSFTVGNILFLMMGDRNDGGPPVGRGAKGGYPAGAVTSETFAWWREMVASHEDYIIISAHHHMLKETTTASGPWEGFVRDEQGAYVSHYHGYYPDGGPEGASYLYFLDDKPDAQAFERYLAEHRGATDVWLGAHTHTHPDDRTGGRSLIEEKWGTTFINVASLSKHHAWKTTVPMSRLLTFTPESDELRIRCYLHTDDYAKRGFYEPAERRVRVRRAFEWD